MHFSFFIIQYGTNIYLDNKKMCFTVINIFAEEKQYLSLFIPPS